MDDTPECINAMRFAALRAAKTGGGVEILGIIAPEEFQHWIGVADAMQAEARERIEEHFAIFATRMEEQDGVKPHLIIREGERVKEVLNAIKQDPEIGVLVLGAATEGDNPGPLVSQLVGRRARDMRVPITVVPGNLSKEDLVAVT